MTIIIAVLFFSLLVLVHEAGHFLTAKKSGIRVDEFGIGYPPRIFGFYKDKHNKWRFVVGRKPKEVPGKTIYSLNLVPFGGFVKIFGQDREEKAASKKNSFSSQSALKRSIVLLSGIGANFVFAILLLSVMFTIGAPVVSQEHQEVDLKDERIMIAEISSDTPAKEVGLTIGDSVIKMQKGDEVLKIEKISQIQEFSKKYQGEKVTIFIERGGEILEKEVLARADYPENQGPLGIGLVKSGILNYPWYQSIWKGITYSFQLLIRIITGFFLLIKTLLTKGEMIGEVAGPIGIFRITGQMAALGWSHFLHFAAFISINLVVLNGLPFPALDGGRFLFILIEKIKGSPVNAKTERIVNSIGFALLILLMVFITVKDVIKIF